MLTVANGWSKEKLQDALDAGGDWFHSFSFSNGAATVGRDPSERKLAALHLPDLAAKSVMDIGAFEGYFSFEAERRGAARVVAVDEFVWRCEPAVRTRLELVRNAIGSRVEDRMIPVEYVNPGEVGEFDVVFFLGVLYHAPNMVDYLQHVRSVTREVAVIETLVDLLDTESPAAALYPSGSLNDDPSNWWGPNLACVENMLARVGFDRVDFRGIWERNTVAQLRGEPTTGALHSGRAVWHAYV